MDKAAVKVYLFTYFRLLAYDDPRIAPHLSDLPHHHLLLSDGLLQLLRHCNGLSFHLLILGPVDHCLPILRKGAIQYLGGVFEYMLLDSSILHVNISQKFRSVVKDALKF